MRNNEVNEVKVFRDIITGMGNTQDAKSTRKNKINRKNIHLFCPKCPLLGQ